MRQQLTQRGLLRAREIREVLRDRIVERGDNFEFANVLVDDLTARATVDDAGVRWSNHEHRATPSALPPRAGWAMGNAGIVRDVLNGRTGPARDVVLFNAGAGLMVAGAVESVRAGIACAADAIDSGAARQVLDRLVGASRVEALA